MMTVTIKIVFMMSGSAWWQRRCHDTKRKSTKLLNWASIPNTAVLYMPPSEIGDMLLRLDGVLGQSRCRIPDSCPSPSTSTALGLDFGSIELIEVED